MECFGYGTLLEDGRRNGPNEEKTQDRTNGNQKPAQES